MKIYSLFKYFSYKHFKFPLGFVYVDKNGLKILKKMPIEYGELKDRDGNVINKPKIKKTKIKKIRRHKDVL